ncbi:Transcriptional activator protein UGA3 [Fusarium odoratissimum]|uniref:Transcriptional activator protein UGA3 n=3 Tax=Fusarium oxysporum species complex TaxID=171631 RepID=N1S104_FUSC4|nr:Transcriptional activator protein UGA3 [Fusarium odoratissimum]
MTQASLDRQFSSRETPRYPTTFRVWQRRTKTGCLTCRSRKKKCDETKPWCSACRRNGIICIWLQDKQPDTLQTRPRNEALTLPNDNNRIFYNKACNLTNLSSLLLQHYTYETAVILPAGKPSLNPFISFVLPPAETDDVLMHSVLAVSGAHLSFRLQVAVDVEMAARKHYVFAIRGVQQVITSDQVKDKSDILRLLLVTSFLSQYEILMNTPKTALHHHLKAIHHLFLHLLRLGYRPPLELQEFDMILSFTYEGFIFLASCNTTQSIDTNDLLPESITDHLRPLTTSPCFGSMLADSHSLFEMIPLIQKLYLSRLTFESLGLPTLSLELWATYETLHDLIESWTSPEASAERIMAGEVVRNALAVFLECALKCYEQLDHESIETKAKVVIDTAVQLGNSSYATHIVWALAVAGSSVVDDIYRRKLGEFLSRSRYKMRHLEVVQRSLDLFWAELNPKMFGPFEFHGLMEKQGISLSIM